MSMDGKIKVVLGQLGSPASPKVSDVRRFLKEFLGDPRVVDAPRILWWFILNLFVLPFRPKKSAKAYGRIWQGDGFPLVKYTAEVAQGLRPHMPDGVELEHCFLLSKPRISEVFDRWEKEDPQTRASRVVVIPQFPQYAESTIGSVVDLLAQDLKKRVNIPTFTVVSDYHRARCFIDHTIRQIRTTLSQNKVDALVISFHGIPLRRALDKNDLYFKHCLETFALIRQGLGELPCQLVMSFQSRFGSEIWLGPYTDETCERLVKEGKKRIAVHGPSFMVDCLETIDELGTELKHTVEAVGGELVYIPCLNADPLWIKDYANFITSLVQGSRQEIQQQYYSIDIRKELMQAQAAQSEARPTPLSSDSKRVLKLMFLTMFLDLIGFSIIFPMFPALAKYYLEFNGQNEWLQLIFSWVTSVESWAQEGAPTGINSVVLFGGILGALYSLLQFVAAPIWGVISDKVGRRPVLIVSVVGLIISYVMWFFAGSFTLLILARIIGGVMSGNLSIASAVVADVTDNKNRSKGMAVIGIAFAMGFLFGPALGGIMGMVNLVRMNPALGLYGVNPFSAAAAVAAALSLINLILLITVFPETLPKEKRGKSGTSRSANPLSLFKPLPYRGINRTNFAYFFTISAFSGMEFTLTFLAVDRFGWSSMQNAYMFIFIGVVLALIQGGYVRRKAHQVGEGKMAKMGIMALVPGLIILAYAHSVGLLYLGLFFLACGSAMVIPCLTALASLFVPSQVQGQALGTFRSLGALGRVIGPLYASLVYWKYSGSTAYLVGAVLMAVPMVLLWKLPRPAAHEAA